MAEQQIEQSTERKNSAQIVLLQDIFAVEKRVILYNSNVDMKFRLERNTL